MHSVFGAAAKVRRSVGNTPYHISILNVCAVESPHMTEGF